jgi:hypothetical protein
MGLPSLKHMFSEKGVGKYISEIKFGYKSEVKGGCGRDSSAGIAASYKLNGPGSVSWYFQISLVLFSYVLLTSSCIHGFAFCKFYITITHSVFCTTYILLFTYCSLFV